MKELPAILHALRAGNPQPAVLATLVSVAGSSYRRPGARLLVMADGTRIGSISGGCLEEDLLSRASRVLASGRAEAVVYDTTSENDLVWGVGLGCHGVVRILVEKLPTRPAWVDVTGENISARRETALAVVHDGPEVSAYGTRLASELDRGDTPGASHVYRESVMPPAALIIFGAGDDAQPLARLAAELGWHVTIADPRAALATPQRFPTANRIVAAAAPELVARVAPDRDAMAVVMTHHYVHDVPILKTLLPRGLAYIGLLGPRKRGEKILTDLAAEGVALTAEQRACVHAPVGLDLGADAPEQVALAIVAEIQATLSRRDARPLRERTRPIHA